MPLDKGETRIDGLIPPNPTSEAGSDYCFSDCAYSTLK